MDILGKSEVLVRGCKYSRTDPHGHFTKSREQCLKYLLGNTEAETWRSWKNALDINNTVNALELTLLGIIEISNSFILYSVTRWIQKYRLYFEFLGLVNDGCGGHLIALDKTCTYYYWSLCCSTSVMNRSPQGI